MDQVKILLINGSPRGEKSNTLRIARALCCGIGAETEEFTLADEKIEPCRGCFSCWGETAGRCVISDSATRAIDKIKAADIIVESYPLYFCGMPGIMKNFADRLLPLTLPYIGKPMPDGGRAFVRLRDSEEMLRKKLIIVSSCGYGETEKMYASIRAQYNAVCGCCGYTGIFCPQGELFGIASLEPQIQRFLGKVKTAGEELLQTGNISRETLAELSKPVIPPRAYEYISLARWSDSD